LVFAKNFGKKKKMAFNRRYISAQGPSRKMVASMLKEKAEEVSKKQGLAVHERLGEDMFLMDTFTDRHAKIKFTYEPEAALCKRYTGRVSLKALYGGNPSSSCACSVL
jgi:hypothetical protein